MKIDQSYWLSLISLCFNKRSYSYILCLYYKENQICLCLLLKSYANECYEVLSKYSQIFTFLLQSPVYETAIIVAVHCSMKTFTSHVVLAMPRGGATSKSGNNVLSLLKFAYRHDVKRGSSTS